jgi:hypothetical protein
MTTLLSLAIPIGVVIAVVAAEAYVGWLPSHLRVKARKTVTAVEPPKE